MTPEYLQKIKEANHNFAVKAIRVLAFAYKEHPAGCQADFADEKDLVCLGLIGMIDPARKEAKDAIAVCKEAGIRAVMITGDFKDSAVAISDNLEMRDEKHMDAFSGEELDRMSDEELRKVVETASVYARVSPEHKVRIVEALKAKNDVKKVKETNDLYNPWYETLRKKGQGTLLWDGMWNLFDQIIVSKNLVGKDRSSFTMFKNEIFKPDYITSKSGRNAGGPFRTTLSGIWQNGYSDHFPTQIYLVKEIDK
jgi:hypothetical protein